ncbi:MAG: hypothetical protein AB7O68_12190 [Pirellulales bacterium]
MVLLMGTACEADDNAKAETASGYNSPVKAFDAYRNAISKRDWRTAFHCWAPEWREHLIFETVFACHLKPDSPKVLALLKAHAADEAIINAAYDARYQERHGVDLARLNADYEAKRAAADPPPMPPTDAALLREVVCSQIADKPGFYAEAANILVTDGATPRIGKLEKLTIRGDKAVGWANETIHGVRSTGGKTNRRFEHVVPVRYQFRKTAHGWLLESTG